MSHLILASNNIGKIREFSALFSEFSIEIIPQGQLGISEAEENAPTFLENALIKARHAAMQGNMAAVADDSGLVVPSLQGAPGVHSARYAGVHGDDKANNVKLLKEMRGIEKRGAYFVCVIVYLRHAHDPLPIIAQGIWHGCVAEHPSGTGGFGYDSVFIPQGMSHSCATLSSEEKNALSHRSQAMRALMQQLTALYSEEK